MGAFKSRWLEKRYPFVIVDALVMDVRRDSAVRSTALLKAYGINEDGYREVLGWYIADSESKAGWSVVFSDLKERGLGSVDVVVSDTHRGLVASVKKYFQVQPGNTAKSILCEMCWGTAPAIFVKPCRAN